MGKISFTRCWTATNKYSKNRRKIEIWNFSVSDHNHSLNDDQFFSHHFFLSLLQKRERAKIIGGHREKLNCEIFDTKREITILCRFHIIYVKYVIEYSLIFIRAIIFCRFDVNYILFIRGRTWDEESHLGLDFAWNNGTGH